MATNIHTGIDYTPIQQIQTGIDTINTELTTIDNSITNVGDTANSVYNYLDTKKTVAYPSFVYMVCVDRFPNAQPVNGDTYVLADFPNNVTYRFVTNLGTPTANTVNVLIQSTHAKTYKMLTRAIMGVIDTANIRYASGVTGNRYVNACFTTKRTGISGGVAEGNKIILTEKVTNSQKTITHTSSVTGFIGGTFVRNGYSTYTFNGNASAAISDLECVVPIDCFNETYIIGSIIIGRVSQTLVNKDIVFALLTSRNEGAGYQCSTVANSYYVNIVGLNPTMGFEAGMIVRIAGITETLQIEESSQSVDYVAGTIKLAIPPSLTVTNAIIESYTLISDSITIPREVANGSDDFNIDSGIVLPNTGLYIIGNSTGTNATEFANYSVFSKLLK